MPINATKECSTGKSSLQFQQAMAQAANQLQKIQKKAAQQQNKNNLTSNPNLGLSGAERPLHQPTKV